MKQLRTLSLQQPFASAIIDGPKRIENRSWKAALKEGGEWIAVHASKGWYPDLDWDEMRRLWPELPQRTDLTRGALLGTMFVKGIVPYEEVEADPWAFGPWCWVVTKVIALPRPIPCSGNRSLWKLSEDIRVQARQQLLEANYQEAL